VTAAGTPLVSVIIAAYNAEAHIEAACRSAIEQTYAPLELIVVDDGSTDDTSRIVEALAASDSRIRLIRQTRRGVAAARNRALSAATGEFIAALDADDLWAHTKVERQVRHLEECGPGTGMVYCWWAWIDGHANVLDRSPRWEVHGRVVEHLVEVNFSGGASVPLYRRSCLDAVGGYDEHLQENGSQGCEDWDLAIRTAERYDVGVVPAVLVGYRCIANSMSSQYETMWQSHARVVAAVAARQGSAPPRVVRRSTAQFAMYLAGVAFRSRDYVNACRWGFRARSLSLGLAVFPHAMRMFTRDMLRSTSATPIVFSQNGHFKEADLAEPLMPYDRIYARRWATRAPRRDR
jgi:glycosyltransferase involved in cell wall biosynthesis